MRFARQPDLVRSNWKQVAVDPSNAGGQINLQTLRTNQKPGHQRVEIRNRFFQS
jgi:hypothetical protein